MHSIHVLLCVVLSLWHIRVINYSCGNLTINHTFSDQKNFMIHKNVSPYSRLSTARGPCLCNISWIRANWLKQYHVQKNTKTHVTLIF